MLDRLDAVVAQLLQGLTAQALEVPDGRASQGHGGHLGLDLLPLLFLALDVDSPAQELRCQSNVLALLSDGKRQLGVIHDHFEVLLLRINHRDVVNLRGAQRIGRKGHRIVVELDDVNLFPAEFADDGLNAHALHAHAGAHAINVGVLRKDGHFRPFAGLAGYRLDDHRAVVDFRHLHLKKFLDQRGVGAGDDHLRPSGCAVHHHDDGPQPVADLVVLEP